MKGSINDIMHALKALGVEGTVTVEYIAPGRIKVIVNGEYFGIWDAERMTFVD